MTSTGIKVVPLTHREKSKYGYDMRYAVVSVGEQPVVGDVTIILCSTETEETAEFIQQAIKDRLTKMEVLRGKVRS